MRIYLKSAYDKPGSNDGLRVLVDRLWPRGMSRERMRLDRWEKELAPSPELRRWFGHDPGKWADFRMRYVLELEARKGSIADFIERIGDAPVTLLFAAKDQQHNNAVVLRDYMEKELEHLARSKMEES